MLPEIPAADIEFGARRFCRSGPTCSSLAAMPLSTAALVAADGFRRVCPAQGRPGGARRSSAVAQGDGLRRTTNARPAVQIGAFCRSGASRLIQVGGRRGRCSRQVQRSDGAIGGGGLRFAEGRCRATLKTPSFPARVTVAIRFSGIHRAARKVRAPWAELATPEDIGRAWAGVAQGGDSGGARRGRRWRRGRPGRVAPVCSRAERTTAASRSAERGLARIRRGGRSGPWPRAVVPAGGGRHRRSPGRRFRRQGRRNPPGPPSGPGLGEGKSGQGIGQDGRRLRSRQAQAVWVIIPSLRQRSAGDQFVHAGSLITGPALRGGRRFQPIVRAHGAGGRGRVPTISSLWSGLLRGF